MSNFIICGELGSGKDTVASLLSCHEQVAFADKLKHIAYTLRSQGPGLAAYEMKQLLPKVPLDQIVSDFVEAVNRFPYDPPKDRPLLQWLGTDYGRSFDNDIWIKALKQKLQNYTKEVIVTDCRFRNELYAFPDYVSVYIDIAPEIQEERVTLRDGSFDPTRRTHISETGVRELRKYCDYIIPNNQSLGDLRNIVDLISHWGKPIYKVEFKEG